MTEESIACIAAWSQQELSPSFLYRRFHKSIMLVAIHQEACHLEKLQQKETKY